MDDDIRRRAIALYDRFTHDTHDRRGFMRELTTLAGSAAAANALLAGIGANPAAAAITSASDKRLRLQQIEWPAANGRTLKGYSARPSGAATKRPAVLVIHENRGLNDHIRDVTRRIALAGFVAVAPDLLTPAGGTPPNEDKARELIGKLDLGATVADCVMTVAWLKRVQQSTGRVGAVGFCWGGAMVNQIAIGAGTALSAGVAYYGPTPSPDRASRVKAAMLLHYAGLDTRVNAGAPAWVAALKEAHVDVADYTYPNVNHAFNNDTAKDRYDKAAAELAWTRTLAFLKGHLA